MQTATLVQTALATALFAALTPNFMLNIGTMGNRMFFPVFGTSSRVVLYHSLVFFVVFYLLSADLSRMVFAHSSQDSSK